MEGELSKFEKNVTFGRFLVNPLFFNKASKTPKPEVTFFSKFHKKLYKDQL